MARVESKLRVGVPVDLAYGLWSRPEEFPNFLAGVTGVRKKGKETYQVTTEVGGVEEHWTIEVHRDSPRQIRWRSLETGRFLGEVLLRTVAEGTEVMLTVDYEPQRGTAPPMRRMVVPTWDVGGDLLHFRLYADGVLEDQAVGA